MTELVVPRDAARRYILGRQGLWPGRRWRGKAGIESAVYYAESVQVDPLNVAGRSHDIALWGRVIDYAPPLLDDLLYQERRLFEYGGLFRIYPIAELPYWRTAMRRAQEAGRYYERAGGESVLRRVRAELRRRGPLGSRDFDDAGQARVVSYRARNQTGHALYHLWMAGELLIHHRERNARVYGFRRELAPPELNRAARPAESEHYFGRKALAMCGWCRITEWRGLMSYFLHHRYTRADAAGWLSRAVKSGDVAVVRVAGEKEPHYLLADDLPTLSILADGQTPAGWKPLDTTTSEEAVFIAPLDVVGGIKHSWRMFDFEYKWEVYTPVQRRRWGYYVLPVLWGDRLVARFDVKLDRASGTLALPGFWPEEPSIARNADFADAFGRGLARFARFCGAQSLDLAGVNPPALRRRVQQLSGM
ncbi:MAG: winged helix DNA-binding domain-containing protein [Chloroflexi bacterium]|nr:winged helix DNA-binding domain-containing protein [Chloroflexota bacterium]